MKKNLFHCFLLAFTLGCGNPTSAPQPQTNDLAYLPPKDSIVFSFAFMGCNRVDRRAVTDPSTSNMEALEKIYADMLQLSPRPKAFFFLGDVVLGETNTQNLDTQLKYWVLNYQKSALANSGIELVAIPGNHELLTYNRATGAEVPLHGSTDVWLRHMSSFMPTDRDTVAGDSAAVNRMTFAFKRGNIGFICLNTDTYNAGPSGETGEEGKIATDWIVQKMKQFQTEKLQHVFLLSHKPAYVNGAFRTDHAGFPQSQYLWQEMTSTNALALLSAHVHNYQHGRPTNSGPFQVIAGNGGSPLDASGVPSTYWGYSIIQVYQSGKIVEISRGYNPPEKALTLRDSLIMR